MAHAAGWADNVFEDVGKFPEALRVGFNAGRDFARRRRTPDPYRAHVTNPANLGESRKGLGQYFIP